MDSDRELLAWAAKAAGLTIIRCVALVQFDGAPVEPCATCARRSESNQHGKNAEEKPRKRTPWTIPPAFWNGTRYVCEHHMEIQHAGA